MEILQEWPNVRHEVSQHCWKNRASKLAWHAVATNLQFVKNPVSAQATKWSAIQRGTVLSRSVVSDSVTLWTIARQVPLSMGFSRQEYWGGLQVPTQRLNLHLPESPALAGGFFTAVPKMRYACMILQVWYLKGNNYLYSITISFIKLHFKCIKIFDMRVLCLGKIGLSVSFITPLKKVLNMIFWV